MFVSFGDASTDVTPRQRALVWPERGVFGVVDGDVDAVELFVGALDAGLRTSRSTDDVAEIIDGVHEELRVRASEDSAGATATFAIVVVEEDALAFFAIGDVTALLTGPGFVRRAIVDDGEHELGGEGAPRFFRGYVRAGDLVVLRSAATLGFLQDAPRRPPSSFVDHDDRELADIVRDRRHKSLADAARAANADARGLAHVTTVVVRVDEEPRIR